MHVIEFSNKILEFYRIHWPYADFKVPNTVRQNDKHLFNGVSNCYSCHNFEL